MVRLFKVIVFLFVLVAFLWVSLMSFLPFLFIKQMEDRYSIQIKGERPLISIKPYFQMMQASFIWNDRVELIDGNFSITIDPMIWLQSKVWAINLKGDGSKLRFLGDWKNKTGVEEIKTERLRLKLDFGQDDIQEIHEVEVISPDYQFQIKSRTISS